MSYHVESEDVIIPEELASPGYYKYAKQALPRFMGYGDHEYQSQIERRIILERAFKANFPVDHIADENLKQHIENYGSRESEQRFRRICNYLHGRGRSLIEANFDKRVDDNHRSFRQTYQTFEDGMWFVETFGEKFRRIGYGRLISEVPEGDYMSSPLNYLTPEPLLIFCIEELPMAHPIFLGSEIKFCKGARESKKIQFEEDSERWDAEKLMIRDKDGNVRCSSCGGDYYSDTAEISEQRYRNHAHLIRRRFETQDFVSDEEFDREWPRQRGRLDPEAEAAIARVFLSDHIAPIRADADEMAGISGDPIKRYGLDMPNKTQYAPIIEKSLWPHEVLRDLSGILARVDREDWEDSTEEERIAILKELGAHTMKRIKDDLEVDIRMKIQFRTDWEFDELMKHVRRIMRSDDSSFAVAGHGRGVRYAIFPECYECKKPGVEFGDGHVCKCSKCGGEFQGDLCEGPECLLYPGGIKP